MDGQSGENGGWEELLARVLLYELAAEVAAEELAAARGEILSMSSDDEAAVSYTHLTLPTKRIV